MWSRSWQPLRRISLLLSTVPQEQSNQAQNHPVHFAPFLHSSPHHRFRPPRASQNTNFHNHSLTRRKTQALKALASLPSIRRTRLCLSRLKALVPSAALRNTRSRSGRFARWRSLPPSTLALRSAAASLLSTQRTRLCTSRLKALVPTTDSPDTRSAAGGASPPVAFALRSAAASLPSIQKTRLYISRLKALAPTTDSPDTRSAAGSFAPRCARSALGCCLASLNTEDEALPLPPKGARSHHRLPTPPACADQAAGLHSLP